VATDHVDALYGHCVIRQQMRFVGQTYRHPGTPFPLAGMSISRFDGQHWVQLWADNQWGRSSCRARPAPMAPSNWTA
jgi:hypothetical protein